MLAEENERDVREIVIDDTVHGSSCMNVHRVARECHRKKGLPHVATII